MVPVPKRRHPGDDIGLDRVPANVSEHRAAEPRLLAGAHCFGHHRQGGEPRVGDEGGARDAELAARLRQLADAARPETDRSGVAPVSGEGIQIFHRSLRLAKGEAYPR